VTPFLSVVRHPGGAAVECGTVTADRPRESLLQIQGIGPVIHTNGWLQSPASSG
jgi:hypothetical protein